MAEKSTILEEPETLDGDDRPRVISGESINWQDLAAVSHYLTAIEVQRAIQAGRYDDAEAGLKELIEALGRSEKRALKSQLVRLMSHVIKWKTQPERRSLGCAASIYNSREEIADIQSETPSLSNDVIESMWDNCFRLALREAEGEMNQKSSILSLSWREVFEEEYNVV
jgi:Domain of unknown function DUF29